MTIVYPLFPALFWLVFVCFLVGIFHGQPRQSSEVVFVLVMLFSDLLYRSVTGIISSCNFYLRFLLLIYVCQVFSYSPLDIEYLKDENDIKKHVSKMFHSFSKCLLELSEEKYNYIYKTV